MTFNDIFKSDFLSNVTSFSVLDTVIALLMSLAIGLLIFFVYKKTFKGVMYNASFGLSLIAMTIITAVIILTITSNVVLSLGMVGALSIVRFRSAVKEAIDIAYLFWSISVGIMLGAGQIALAVIASVFIALVMIIFVNRRPGFTPYMLVVSFNGDDTEKAIINVITKNSGKYIVKSKSIDPSLNTELSVEIRLKNMSTVFMSEIVKLSGVTNATLVTYNGDYMN